MGSFESKRVGEYFWLEVTNVKPKCWQPCNLDWTVDDLHSAVVKTMYCDSRSPLDPSQDAQTEIQRQAKITIEDQSYRSALVLALRRCNAGAQTPTERLTDKLATLRTLDIREGDSLLQIVEAQA